MHSHGMQRRFITPNCPQQNERVERVMALKEQRAHRHRFES